MVAQINRKIMPKVKQREVLTAETEQIRKIKETMHRQRCQATKKLANTFEPSPTSSEGNSMSEIEYSLDISQFTLGHDEDTETIIIDSSLGNVGSP